MKMPHRSGTADGLIAIWGKITLAPLDQASRKILADGKSPKKGLLIDFAGNFVRSAKEGLPIYRIDGGPGFIWGASFGRKGRATLRLAAVNLSGFLSPSPEEQPTPQSTHETETNKTQAELEQANKTQAELEQTNKTQAELEQANKAQAELEQTNKTQAEFEQTIEKLQIELASATAKIAELEKAKEVAEAARTEAAKPSVDVATAKREIEQTIVAERARLEATIARVNADKAAANTEGARWEGALYGVFGGLFVVLTALTAGFFINRRKQSISNHQVCELGTQPIDVSGQADHSQGEIMPHTLSPEIAAAGALLERELAKQVAAINATQDAADGQDRTQQSVLAGTGSDT
jgi:hypothetical protein